MVYTLLEVKEAAGYITLSNDGAEYIEKYMLSASCETPVNNNKLYQ